MWFSNKLLPNHRDLVLSILDGGLMMPTEMREIMWLKIKAEWNLYVTDDKKQLTYERDFNLTHKIV
jgi:hypothetical protein